MARDCHFEKLHKGYVPLWKASVCSGVAEMLVCVVQVTGVHPPSSLEREVTLVLKRYILFFLSICI